MAKSIRSHIKKKFRAEKRATVGEAKASPQTGPRDGRAEFGAHGRQRPSDESGSATLD